MALLSTTQPGSVGLDVRPGTGGGLSVTLCLTAGSVTILLTSQEAYRLAGIVSTLLMSHRESYVLSRANSGLPDGTPLPPSGETSPVAT